MSVKNVMKKVMDNDFSHLQRVRMELFSTFIS